MNQSAKAPVHLWIVGAVSLLWNGYGVYDYLMSVTRNEAYLANFPPEMIALLDSFPAWAMAAWAIGVWVSLAAVVLLLLRNRLAVTAFAISIVGVIVSNGYQMTLDLPPSLQDPAYTVMSGVILVVALAQWWYARWLTGKGVLR